VEQRENSDWDEPLYYHFCENPGPHKARPHYGVRTDRYKLIYCYLVDEWELFDLHRDPNELTAKHSRRAALPRCGSISRKSSADCGTSTVTRPEKTCRRRAFPSDAVGSSIESPPRPCVSRSSPFSFSLPAVSSRIEKLRSKLPYIPLAKLATLITSTARFAMLEDRLVLRGER